ncbi:lasso peptide isopeptide bond-forming cyclase [Nostoc sp. UHCC 0702]|nr:lasso peptide isopeptide bond-forming cyclase [Nostoc sp. UHCC 0702]
MSGIVGIYNLDGLPVEREHLGRMVNILAHRGPDGADIWCEGSVGLGHRMLWTTPESLLEKLPLVNRTGNLVMTADARIDNRDELICALSLNHRPAEKITDSELILAAYEKWGKQCPERLIGDFTFAIWDQQKQVLFCARDHMGVKPFYYYHQPGKFFAFASEIKGLLCLEAVPRKINEAKVGIYLCQLSGFAELKPETFYQHILRLPPAHWMELSEKGMECKSYWDLDAEAKKIQQVLKSDSDYVEAFRERFTEAIACRLRSAYPIVSTLSGGLDSSSVSCVARNLLKQQNPEAELLTVYADCGVPSTDEKAYVNTVLAQGGFKHHIGQVSNPIGSAQTVTPWLDQPVQMPTPAMLLTIVQSVHQQGARVMLTGHDGDTIVSHGQDYPNELIESGEWQHLKKIVEAGFGYTKDADDAADLEKKIKLELYKYLLPYLKELIKNFKIKKYIKTCYRAFRNWSFSPRNMVGLLGRSIYQNLRRLKWKEQNSFIHADFAFQINLGKLLQAEIDYQFAYLPSEYLNHYRGITSGNLLEGTEQIDAISSALAIEPRHPFLDKRLVELCLAVPAHLKFCNGFGRGVMRRAMKDILPEEVRRRVSKVDFYGFIVPAMENDERKLIDDLLLAKKSNLSHYLHTNALYQEYQYFSNSATPCLQRRRRARMITCVIFLSMWAIKEIEK